MKIPCKSSPKSCRDLIAQHGQTQGSVVSDKRNLFTERERTCMPFETTLFWESLPQFALEIDITPSGDSQMEGRAVHQYQPQTHDARKRKDKKPTDAVVYECRTEPLCKCQVVIMSRYLAVLPIYRLLLPPGMVVLAKASTVVLTPARSFASQGIVDGQTKENRRNRPVCLPRTSTMLLHGPTPPCHRSR